MSKAARQSRRADGKLAAKHPAALSAAADAKRSFERTWSSIEQTLSAGFSALVGTKRGIRLRPDDLHREVRARRADGWDWPAATYWPAPVCGAAVIASICDAAGVPRSQFTGQLIEQHTAQLGVQVATLLGWHRAPLVAVFDPDLAAALIATPMSGEVPRELLQRLPSWSVYIPTPWLRSSVGVFVTYDAGTVTRDGQPIHADAIDDDLVMLFVIDDADTMFVAFFRCCEPTVAASMESQFRDVASRGPATLNAGAGESERLAVELFGQSYRQTIEEIMALVLYLCSEEPDLQPVAPSATNTRTRPTATAASLHVLVVGYRVGAALRHAGLHASADSGGGHHARPIPHVRVAHWHTYWYGPRNDPAARTARLRWIAPVLVNADLDAAIPTARTVHPPPPLRKTTGHRHEGGPAAMP